MEKDVAPHLPFLSAGKHLNLVTFYFMKSYGFILVGPCGWFLIGLCDHDGVYKELQ